MRLLKTFAGTILLALLASSAPAAAPKCGPHDDITRGLGTRYGEARQAIGVAKEATPPGIALVEIWANLDTGTWTILVVTASGKACMVADGEAYTIEIAQIPGDPA